MKPQNRQPNGRLVQARRCLGLSQSDIAHHLNVSVQEVWRWENGVAHPHPRSYQRLCTLLQKTAQELGLNGEPDSFPVDTLPSDSFDSTLQACLKQCQADPRYQLEYQNFLQHCQQLSPHQRHTISFVEWLLAAHPEQIALPAKLHQSELNRPA